MRREYIEPATKGKLLFIESNCDIKNSFIQKGESLPTIAWNRGEDQIVTIDEIDYVFKKNQFLTLMLNQSFHFAQPEVVAIWQFNRDFYCIIDHDKEVSCVGFLFYGWEGTMFLDMTAEEIRKMDTLMQIFVDEFETHDNIQGEMLLMLLKRLIILLTRIAKKQYLGTNVESEEYDIVREFSLLVSMHYKKLHQVQDYATLLHKAPKTLSNLFAKYSDKTPLQIIRERIILEAKRLLLYTDLSISEVAYELGFEESAHFSRFFKKMQGESPSRFKKRGEKPNLPNFQ